MEVRRGLAIATGHTASALFMQWPQTSELIEERLGPPALVVSEENVGALRQRLSAAGLTLEVP